MCGGALSPNYLANQLQNHKSSKGSQGNVIIRNVNEPSDLQETN